MAIKGLNLYGNMGNSLRKQNKKLATSLRNQKNKIAKQLKTNNKQQQEALKKVMNIKVKSIISKESRIRVPAKRRHEVEDKYKNKCAVKNCRGRPLQIHHKNMKSSDNRLVNLELLCANDHYAKHAKGSKLNAKARKRKARANNKNIFRF